MENLYRPRCSNPLIIQHEVCSRRILFSHHIYSAIVVVIIIIIIIIITTTTTIIIILIIILIIIICYDQLTYFSCPADNVISRAILLINYRIFPVASSLFFPSFLSLMHALNGSFSLTDISNSNIVHSENNAGMRPTKNKIWFHSTNTM